MINRFSEDIDLILDWRVLGYTLNEPWETRSNTQQDRFNKEANEKAEVFLQNELLPVLQADLVEILGENFTLYIDETDRQTICFAYPKIFMNDGILQIIRLEIGALAAWTPSKEKVIKPYVAEMYPNVFEQSDTTILTAAAERTFWEKVTILHHEANRPEHLSMPKRYSRHYYDLYCIAKSENKQMAYKNTDLLKKVVEFKMKFYPRKWAKYEEAVPGTIKLLPPAYRYADLESDYKNMSEMMFGEYPTFEKLMEFIKDLEKEINEL